MFSSSAQEWDPGLLRPLGICDVCLATNQNGHSVCGESSPRMAARMLSPKTGSCSSNRGRTLGWGRPPSGLCTGLCSQLLDSGVEMAQRTSPEMGTVLHNNNSIHKGIHVLLHLWPKKLKKEIAHGVIVSRSPLCLSAINNFQSGCWRISNDRHIMFMKDNFKRNLSALKVRAPPSRFLASRPAIEMSDFLNFCQVRWFSMLLD